ncbi:ChaN family lipoprotein [Vibrio sp. WXL103]|uniref:ChaN family lipoprotein n=1 Tax=Vibrio sp. WXL103 TaxID=3450710 RepID=UPI003EC8D3AB
MQQPGSFHIAFRRCYTVSVALLVAGCIPSSQSPAGISGQSVSHHFDYQMVDENNTPILLANLPKEILQADVVLVGEWHGHAGIHRFQADLYQQLMENNPRVTLSMEQFTRDKQTVVDAYLQGEVGEQFLIDKGDAWPDYTRDYRALVELAKNNQQPVIASNAPSRIVRCVGRLGPDYLETLDDSERGWVAQRLDLSDNPYKRLFMASMHHGPVKATQDHYAAQLTWDETMAESIVLHLKQNPRQQVMHIAGDFHINEGLAIGRIITRLEPSLDIVTISPSSKGITGSDYTIKVLSPPPRYIQEHHRVAAYHSVGKVTKVPACR